MNRHLLAILAICACQLLAAVVEARSSYDGQWNITFVTQSGDCNPTYNYSVNIENGVIMSPNVETFRGNVTSSGAVRASVTVQEKHIWVRQANGRSRPRDLDRLVRRPALRGILDSPADMVITLVESIV
jgi:hypothetical protein